MGHLTSIAPLMALIVAAAPASGGAAEGSVSAGDVAGGVTSPERSCKGVTHAPLELEPDQLTTLVERVRRHRPVTEEELSRANRRQLWILRNAVFASHGLAFRSDELREYFGGFAWYRPARTSVDRLLVATDRQNVARIQEAESCTEDGPADEAPVSWAEALASVEAPADRELSAVDRSLIGFWEDCMVSPDQECGSVRFYPDGRILLKSGREGRVGTWRTQDANILVHFTAEVRLVGGSPSPAFDPDDDLDDGGGSGVPRLFKVREKEERFGSATFEEVRDDQGDPWLVSCTFGGRRYWKKSDAPGSGLY